MIACHLLYKTIILSILQKKVTFFFWDRCCHPKTCLHLMEANWNEEGCLTVFHFFLTSAQSIKRICCNFESPKFWQKGRRFPKLYNSYGMGFTPINLETIYFKLKMTYKSKCKAFWSLLNYCQNFWLSKFRQKSFETLSAENKRVS